jgi:DNA-binding FadR family transcriptional regulator
MSERALARDLNCSRDTLRSVLDRLEREGMIWRHVGQGTFVGPRPASEPIRPAVLFDQATPGDLMDARLVIEPAVAGAAAAVATDLDIARMRALAQRTRDASDWRTYEVADAAFHNAIATATDNRLLAAILGLLSSVRGRSRWQRQHDAAFRRAREREYSLSNGDIHLDIVDAIALRDSSAASELMRGHLMLIRELMTSTDTKPKLGVAARATP